MSDWVAIRLVCRPRGSLFSTPTRCGAPLLCCGTKEVVRPEVPAFLTTQWRGGVYSPPWSLACCWNVWHSSARRPAIGRLCVPTPRVRPSGLLSLGFGGGPNVRFAGPRVMRPFPRAPTPQRVADLGKLSFPVTEKSVRQLGAVALPTLGH